MGRTVPTFTERIHQAAEHWSKFRRALLRQDRPYFDRIFQTCRTYPQSIMYQASDNAMETILLTKALDQEKRIATLEKLLGIEPVQQQDCLTFAEQSDD